MSTNRSFFGSAFYYTLGVILAQGTTFVTVVIVLARMMNAEQYGLISLYATWVSIFGTIAGIQAQGTINNAKIDFGVDRLNAYTSASFGLGTVSLTILFGIFLAFQNFLSTSLHFSFGVILLILIQGFFSFAIQHLAAKYQVLNQPGKFVFWTALVTFVRLGASVALVYMFVDNSKYLGDVYGSSIAYGLVGLAACVMIFVQGKTFFHAAWWKYCLKISLPLVFSGLATYILFQADRVMLQNMSTPEEVGIYSYVYAIAMVTTGVWLAFNKPWSVWYFDKTHAGDKKAIINLYKKYCAFITMLSIGFTLICPDIVRILGSQEFQSGIYIIPLLAAGCYLIFLYSFPVNYESYKQKTVYIAVGTVSAAALNIGLNLYTIPHYGGMGAAAASLISFFMLFIFHYIISKYVIKGFEISFIQLLIPALCIFAALAATYLFMDVWPVRWAVCILMLVFSFRTYRQSRHIMME